VLDELKVRYKAFSLGKRMGICFLMGLLPAGYIYYDQAAIIEEDFAKAESDEKAAAQKLLEADAKLKNLEKTEAELSFTTDQLKKAETRLPDSLAVDEILRHFGKTAKDSAITIVSFQPEPEVIRGDEYKYVEMPLKMSVEAHEYAQICSWLDTIAGIKSKIYLRSWNMRRSVGAPDSQEQARAINTESKNASDEVAKAEAAARSPRENLKLTVSAELSVFRLANGPAPVPAAEKQPTDGTKATGGAKSPAQPPTAALRSDKGAG